MQCMVFPTRMILQKAGNRTLDLLISCDDSSIWSIHVLCGHSYNGVNFLTVSLRMQSCIRDCTDPAAPDSFVLEHHVKIQAKGQQNTDQGDVYTEVPL